MSCFVDKIDYYMYIVCYMYYYVFYMYYYVFYRSLKLESIYLNKQVVTKRKYQS